MLSHAPTPESCKHFVLQDRCFSPKIQIFSAFRPIAASGGRLLPSRGDPNSVPRAGGRRAGFRGAVARCRQMGCCRAGKLSCGALWGRRAEEPSRRCCRAGPRGTVKRRSRRGVQANEGRCAGCLCAELLSGAGPPRQGTPAGYLSGSTWMAIIVPAPKRTRRRCSMSTVSACE